VVLSLLTPVQHAPEFLSGPILIITNDLPLPLMEKHICDLVEAGLNAAIDTNRTTATAKIDKGLIFIHQITLKSSNSDLPISKRY
jgi:hypothetical protein